MSIASTAMSKVGCPYIWGASGALCTPQYRKTMIQRYPNYAKGTKSNCQVLFNNATSCNGCPWYDTDKHEAKPSYDCAGFCRSVYKANGITIASGATSIWNNTEYSKRGVITDNFPHNTVCLIFRGNDKVKEHIGIYLGNGYEVEAANSKTGVVHRIFDISKWQYWMIPKGQEEQPMEFSEYNAMVKTNRDGYISLWSDNTKKTPLTRICDGDVVCVTSVPDAKGFVSCKYNELSGVCDSQYLVPVKSNEDAIKLAYQIKGIAESLIDLLDKV